MKQAKKIILGLIIFASIIIFFIWIEIRQTTVRQPDSIVNIPNPIGTKLDISLEIRQDQFNFPEQAQQIQISIQGPTTRETAETFARQIGFDGTPRTANDISYGSTYSWSDQTSSFVIHTGIHRGTYSVYKFENTQITQDLSAERVQAIAERFLYDNNFFERDTLEMISIEHYDAGHEELRKTTPEKANIIQINFLQSTQEEFNIVSLNPEFSPIEVWITNNGEVTRAIFHFLDFTTTERNINLINYNDLAKRLDQSILITVDEGNIPVPTLGREDIGKITISEIELAYYYQYPEKNTLAPVFVLKGLGVVYEQEFSVILYLPAAK